MTQFTSSWEEYRLLVINELEDLNKRADSLDQYLRGIVIELALVRQSSDKVEQILEKIVEADRAIRELSSNIGKLEEKIKTHQGYHDEAKRLEVLNKFKVKDRHWAVALSVIGAIIAFILALLK